MKKYQEIINKIKDLAQQQVELKPQRKTKNFTAYNGTKRRHYKSFQATAYHLQNRTILRHLYHTYALLRGRQLPVYKNAEINAIMIKSLVEQFTPQETEAA